MPPYNHKTTMQSKHIFGQHHHSPPHPANANFYHFYTQPSHALNLPQNRNSTPQLHSASDQEQKRERETYLVSIEEERKEEKPWATKKIFCYVRELREETRRPPRENNRSYTLPSPSCGHFQLQPSCISSVPAATSQLPNREPNLCVKPRGRIEKNSDSLCVSIACCWGNLWANLS